MTLHWMIRTITRRRVLIVLLVLIVWYGVATLPYIGDYPPVRTDEMGIVAPAYKLASTGVYGNDLYRGFYRAEIYNYEYMPLYPLLEAIVFRLAGASVAAARFVSVLAGLAVLLLTFEFGRRLYDTNVGVAAVAVLSLLRLGHVPLASGVPLFDFARVIRYDVLVPVWVVATCLAFHYGYTRRSPAGYLGAGICAGLATLTHVYGAFVLAVPIVVVLWHEGRQASRHLSRWLLMVLGWLVTLLPWLAYVAQAPDAFRGQMLRHQTRFALLNPWFYIENLLHEPWRFLPWLGGSFRSAVLWPRVGIWVFAIGLVGANVLLWKRVRRQGRVQDRLLFAALPVLWLLLAALVSFKRYTYITMLLPFWALQLGLFGVWLWRRSQRRWQRTLIALVVVAMTLEAGTGVVGNLRAAQQTVPYSRLTARITTGIPGDARLLAEHRYWLGLANYDVLSIDLPFVLSDDRYGYADPPTMEEAVAGLAPDYVVIEEELLKAYLRTPEQVPHERLAQQLEALDTYVSRRCDREQRITAPAYGHVLVFRCVHGEVSK